MIDYSRYYRAYAEMKDTLDGDYAKMYLTAAMADNDDGNDSLNGNMSNRVIDMDWVLVFEDCIPYIEKAIDQQRKFIEEYNQVDRIDKIKMVRKDAITHLTQHTNLIQSIEDDGSVVPGQLLNTLREDSFATYENRFLYTLIFKAISFIEARFRALQNAPNDSDAEVSIHRDLQLNKQKLSLNIAYNFESHERDKVNKEEALESLTDYERILRLRMKLDDFVNTELIQKLNGCIKVKSPINKTNCIKQDPAFKKCYELWTFIEGYLKPGFVLEVDTFDGTMPEDMKQEMYDLMAYEHFVMLLHTNPALKEKLNNEYLAEKKRREEEANKPEEELQRYIEEQIYQVRREEMALRLAEVRDRESQIIKLQAELEQERERVRELENKVEQLTALLEQREKELQEAKDELRMVQVHVVKLETAVDALQNRITFLNGYISQLENDCKEYADTINEMNGVMNDYKKQIGDLTFENINLRETIRNNEETIAKNDALIAQQKDTVNLTTAALDKLNGKYQQLQNDHEELIDKYSSVDEKYNEYETRIAQQLKEKEDLAHTIRVNENMLSAKDAIINTANERRDELQKRVDAFDEYHNKIKKESDEIKDKFEARESEVVGLSNTVASQSAAMAKHQEELKSMQKQIDRTTRDKEEALDNMKNSYEDKINEIKESYEARIRSLEQQTINACNFTDEQKYSLRLMAEKKAIQADYDKKLEEATKKAKSFVKKARVLATDYPDKLLMIPEAKDYM